MTRGLGQFFSLFALVASAINAQCALACSLEGAPSSIEIGVARHQAARTDHACCPEKRSKAPKQKQRNQPCANPAPSVARAAEVTPSQHVDAPHLAKFDDSNAKNLDIPTQLAEPPDVFDSSPHPLVTAFFVLRV